MNTNLMKGYILAAITTICWGTTFVFCKLVYLSDIGPFLLLFLRYLIASLLFLIIFKKRPRCTLNRVERRSIFAIGAVGYFLQAALCFAGMKFVSATMGSLINALTPIGTILFAVICLKECLTLKKLSGILISTVGAIIIIGFSGEGNTLLGIFLNLSSVLLWSLMTVIIRKYSSQIDVIWLTIYASLVAMIVSFPFAFMEIMFSDFNIKSVTPIVITSIVLLAVLGTACSNIWWSKALELVPATTCSMFYALMPVATALIDIFALNESLEKSFLCGGIVVIIGMAIAVTSENEMDL